MGIREEERSFPYVDRISGGRSPERKSLIRERLFISDKFGRRCGDRRPARPGFRRELLRHAGKTTGSPTCRHFLDPSRCLHSLHKRWEALSRKLSGALFGRRKSSAGLRFKPLGRGACVCAKSSKQRTPITPRVIGPIESEGLRR